eukprot:3344684-Rhodomonas_salina.3
MPETPGAPRYCLHTPCPALCTPAASHAHAVPPSVLTRVSWYQRIWYSEGRIRRQGVCYGGTRSAMLLCTRCAKPATDRAKCYAHAMLRASTAERRVLRACCGQRGIVALNDCTGHARLVMNRTQQQAEDIVAEIRKAGMILRLRPVGSYTRLMGGQCEIAW